VGGKDKEQFLNGEFSIPRSTLRTSNFIWSFSAFESNITTQKITMRKECSFDPSHTIIEMIHLFFLRLLGRHRCCSICPTSRIYWWKKQGHFSIVPWHFSKWKWFDEMFQWNIHEKTEHSI
jgi:hypothetical protein